MNNEVGCKMKIKLSLNHKRTNRQTKNLTNEIVRQKNKARNKIYELKEFPAVNLELTNSIRCFYFVFRE